MRFIPGREEDLNSISVLQNPVQEYAWGSRSAIQTLLGLPVPGKRPAAEVWMGAHPKAPSRVLADGEWRPLHEVIRSSPESVLGRRVAEKFSNRLPFLFKVLAAERPLSVQVHPNREQARAGFERESRLGVSLNAPERNFRDQNHKPEILCALTRFEALKGFRVVHEIFGLMEKVCERTLSLELGLLRDAPDAHGLQAFFSALLRMEENRRRPVIDEALKNAERHAHENEAYGWMATLEKEYAYDMGVFSPLFLNLIHLEPGEAIFLPPGELHAYLKGMGMELMANSDNVLRGGLTPKHVDLPELLKVVDFTVEPATKIMSLSLNPCQEIYPAPAEEFLLSRISVDKEMPFTSDRDRSVEIVMCVEGDAEIKDLKTGDDVAMPKGRSVIIPASILQYRVHGRATLYTASVPS
jgi:mannose-6-phosphate isomerase